MYQINIQKINLQSDERLEVEKFLSSFDLSLDKDVQYTLVAKMDKNIVGTCSFTGKVIKCFAVKKDMQGEGVAAKLISSITNAMFDKGIFDSFIFTKPANKYLFVGFGYHEVYEAEDVILLESGSNNVEKYIKSMYNRSELQEVEKAALVMNCNPFTLGHRHLIEKAAKENKEVVVFVVEEDKSVFPFNVRYNLVKEGVKDLKNVHVIPGGDYIISSNTFPTYFIKENEKKDKAFKELDAGIFGKYIAPVFNIKRRYIGTEPFCQVTSGYNEALINILPKFDVEVKMIDRLSIDNIPVSASEVRKYIKEGNLNSVKKLVPETTFLFLQSKDAEYIIEKIKESESRH